MQKNMKFVKMKTFFLGNAVKKGFLNQLVIYTLLISIGYIFLYPIFKMVSNSLMDLNDLLSPMVVWIPRKLYLHNYVMAFRTLNYVETFFTSLVVTLLPALIQTFILSFVGYGLAKFKFPGKKLILGFILLSYILPPQVTMIPKYVLFNNLKLTDGPFSIILPALFGQGLNSAIFIFIFYQFFRMIPKSLDEAALMDGANRYYIFFKIAIPLTLPAYITSFLFSFVWYWNESYIASIFLGSKFQTLQLNLISFSQSFESISNQQGFPSINEGIKDAGTMLVILPMLIVYFILQKRFIEGIDKTGIAGGE